MTDIPVGITHGYVAGVFNEIVRDSGDAGSVPDAVPLEGTVEARWLGREISGDTARLDKTRHLVEGGAMYIVQDYTGATALAVTAGQLPATALVSGWWQLTYQLSGVDLWRYEVRVGTESEGTPLNIALAPADAPPAVIAASAALVESLKAEVQDQLATFGNRLGGVEDTAAEAGTQATNAAASATASAQAAGQAQTAAQNAQTAANDAGTALTNATQAIANKTRTWRQTTPPTPETVGDQWYHIGENNKLRIWDGSAWVAALPGPGAIGFSDPTNAFPNPGLLPELWRPTTGTFHAASDANVPTGCPQPYVMRTNYRTNYLPPINATEGDVIYFSVWVSPDMSTPNKTVAARIKAIDKDNQLVAWLSTEANPTDAYATQSSGVGWRRIFGRFRMPENTAMAVPYVLVDQHTPYETHWFMSGMTVTREDGHLVDETMISAANGVASLDSSAKVPVAQVPHLPIANIVGLSSDLQSRETVARVKERAAITVGGAGASYNLADYSQNNACLQAALDDADASGKPVVILSKQLIMWDGVTVHGGTKLSGASGNSLKWKGSSDQGGGHMLTVGGTSIVSDLSILGSSGVTNASAIKVVGSYAKLRSLVINDQPGDGIVFTGTGSSMAAHACKLHDINIKSCTGRGMHYKQWCYDGQMSDIWIGYCGTGIRVDDSQQLFSNVHVFNSNANGIEVRASHVTMVGGYIESNNGKAVDGYTASDFKMSGVRVWKNCVSAQGYAVYLQNGSRATITDSTFHNNNGYGLIFNSFNDSSVTGCKFYDDQAVKTQTYGMGISGSSDYITVKGNHAKIADHLSGGINNNTSGTNLDIGGNWT